MKEWVLDNITPDFNAPPSLSYSGDRDISEKIALGIAQPKMSKESMYDQRLFNQSAGIGSGFSGGDDSYNLYDKPLFAGGSASTIYRPGRAGDDSMAAVSGVKEEAFERLLGEGGGPHKGFSGADGGASVTAGGDKKGLRDGPVLFEKEDAADPFGLEEFMTTARKGKEKEAQREGRGTMHAS